MFIVLIVISTNAQRCRWVLWFRGPFLKIKSYWIQIIETIKWLRQIQNPKRKESKMKKIRLNFEVYYNGNLSDSDEIGELTIEVALDEERIRKKRQFIESENDIDFDNCSHKIPVNYTRIFAKNANVIKKKNIDSDNDAFELHISEDVVSITTRGEDISVEMGYPEPC